MPSQQELTDSFAYDPKTGDLIWKESRCGRVKTGTIAGCFAKKSNRWYVRFKQKLHARSRLVYQLFNGDLDSSLTVDHVNGDTSDDRIENLRAVTQQENCQNAKMPKNNKSGVRGIHKAKGKWVAQIGSKANRRHLGTYETIEEATFARKEAEVEMNYHPNHGRVC